MHFALSIGSLSLIQPATGEGHVCTTFESVRGSFTASSLSLSPPSTWVSAVVPPFGRHPYQRLTDAVVRQARSGRHVDGNGLHLLVRPNGARSWVQRLVILGNRRDLGLGGYPLVTLATARKVAEENRRVARSGGDPVAAPSRKAVPSVREVFEDVIAARSVSWRNPATERKWRRLFETLVLPGIGAKPVDEVTLDDLREIVLPHWHGRGSTGYVVRQHLDSVMRWSVAHGHRSDNPAEQLKVLVPKVKAVVHHHPSLPHRKVCDAMRAVDASRADEAVKLALLFTVLCVARVGEVGGAAWSEMDLEGRVWTRPAERMKAQQLHQVPLSAQALAVLDRMRALARSGPLVFALRNRRGGTRAVAAADLAAVLRPLGFVDEQRRSVVMHGFRATFRVWAMEVERASFESCEAALAHTQSDQTVAAYARSELFEVRRELMQAWADYVVPGPGR